MVLVINGLLDKETAKIIHIPEYKIRDRAMMTSFQKVNLTDGEKLHKIKHYFKFVMIRNPLERVVSAYRNKLEQPLRYNRTLEERKGLLEEPQFFQGMKRFENYKRWILTKYRPLDLLRWMQKNGSYELQVTFADFIQWKIDLNDYTVNEHFSSALRNTHPCKLRYHFYANFKNYSREVLLLIEKFNTRREYFTDYSKHDPWDETKLFLNRYYSQLHQSLKYRLFRYMYKELDFYYHLYPEEQWSHVELLRINIPIYYLTVSDWDQLNELL